MELRKFTCDDLIAIFPTMEEDFPEAELKPLDRMVQFFQKGFMEGYGLYQGERLLAYAFFLCRDDVRLFDYLAVTKEERGTGIGSLFLQKLREVYGDQECIIGEVENPDYCSNETEKQIMEKRIHFYMKNGFHDTGATGCVYGVEYRFIEMTVNREHTKREGFDRINLFYRLYWPDDETYNRYVQMHEENIIQE